MADKLTKPSDQEQMQVEPISFGQLPAVRGLYQFAEYYKQVLNRTFKETVAFFEFTPRRVITAISLYILVVVFTAWLWPQGLEQAMPGIAIWLAAVVVFAIFLLAVNFVRAPCLIDRDRAETEKKLADENSELIERRKPRLKIIFEPDKGHPYVQTYARSMTIYRVKIESTIPLKNVLLRANNVDIGGTRHSKLHMHVMNDNTHTLKRVELYPDTPDYWDIVTNNPAFDEVRVEHIEKDIAKGLSPGRQTFEIVASGGETSDTKIVTIERNEDKSLVVHIREEKA